MPYLPFGSFQTSKASYFHYLLLFQQWVRCVLLGAQWAHPLKNAAWSDLLNGVK